jgi:proteasome accessory factor C
MTARLTADEQLLRIAQLIAHLRERGPRRIADVAAELDITPAQLLKDVNQLLGRIFYRPGGWAEDIQIFVDGDLIWVTRSSTFQRPARLSTLETLCLMLALDSAPAESFGDPSRLRKLMQAAQLHLAGVDWTEQALESVLAADFSPDPVGLRQLLIRAAREQIPCTITYLKPGQSEAEVRTIHPRRIIHSEGNWYAMAWCTLRQAMRHFRIDRILDGVLEEGKFEITESMDPDDLPSEQIQRADGAAIVQVRYDAAAVPWVIEDAKRRGLAWTDVEDGRVEIAHRVGDVAWLVHHVLALAPAAEVVAPKEVRTLIVQVLDAFLDTSESRVSGGEALV